MARELDSAPEGGPAALRSQLHEPAEIALLEEIERRRTVIDDAVREGRHFRAAYTEAAAFEPAIARFFNDVFVMADDAALRRARLGLLKHLEQLILQLGDISEIVAPES